jgi:hypothetical protein
LENDSAGQEVKKKNKLVVKANRRIPLQVWVHSLISSSTTVVLVQISITLVLLLLSALVMNGSGRVVRKLTASDENIQLRRYWESK